MTDIEAGLADEVELSTGSAIDVNTVNAAELDMNGVRHFSTDSQNGNDAEKLDYDKINCNDERDKTLTDSEIMLGTNDSNGAVNGNDGSDSDVEDQLVVQIHDIKSEFDPDANVVVLNKHNKYNARPKPDANSLRHECELCDDAFQYPYQLARHKKVKHEGKYPYHCKVCNKPFDRRSSLRDHMFVHSEDRPYPCKLCSKSFKMNGNLRKHLREMHLDETEGPKLKFQCEYCSKIFPTKERLTSHFVCHETEKAFSCDICGKKFNRKNNLKKHQVIHSSEKNFKCPDCHMCFNRQYSLKIHSRNHMAVKPYRCELCPSSFSQLHALKTHFRLHTGEKPFKCTVCPQTFRQLATLQVHLKRHSGVKDFKCMVCGRAFVIKRRLTEHMRLHTGEKPFSCKLCPYKAATASGLRLHNKTHLRQMERSALKINPGTTELNASDSVKKRRRSPGRSSSGVKDSSVELVKALAESEYLTGDTKEETKEIQNSKKVDNSEDDRGGIAINSIQTEALECAIEIVNDAILDTSGVETGTNTEEDSEEMIGFNNVAECSSDCNVIGVKVSNVRSIAGAFTESSEMEIASEQPDARNEKSKHPVMFDFKFSASEILYKHLNDFIPTIDAGILSDKIECIVSELADIKETKNNTSSNGNLVRRKTKQKSVKSARVRKLEENADMSLIKTLRSNTDEKTEASVTNNRKHSAAPISAPYEDMNKILVKNEPVNLLNSTEPSQNISEIQASHRTLSLSLLSCRETTPAIAPVTVKLEQANIQENDSSPSNSENSERACMRSTLRKMLTTAPKKLDNNTSASEVCGSIDVGRFINTKIYHCNDTVVKSGSGIKHASNHGNNAVLREILSKPPLYLVSSRNSVAALQRAKRINDMKARNGENHSNMSKFVTGMTSNDFPWISIDSIKLEPLSEDEN